MKRLPILSLLVLALIGAAPAQATTVVDFPMPELVRRSNLVIRGTVEHQQSAWDEGHRRIYTTTRIQVAEVLRGQKPSTTTISVVQPGGTVGDVGQNVDGTAKFSVGEEVVVFVEPRDARATHFALVGLAATKFSVLRENNASVLKRDVRGLTLMERDRRGRLVPRAAPPVERIQFDELRAAARDVANSSSRPVRQQ